MADATTNALLDESKCLVCYPDSVQLEMQTYIIAHAAGVGMDPIQLAKDAKCFTCLNPLTLVEAKLYLLARIAQIGTDPVDLLEGTECYECIPQGMLTSVETNDLVNDPASPSTDPATIARLSRCFGCLSGQTLLEVQVYLLALLANVTPTTEEIEKVIPPIDRIPPGRIRSVIVRQQGRIRNGGGLVPSGPSCTDVPADLIPTITATYTAGVVSSLDISFPKVCCHPGGYWIYARSTDAQLQQGIIPAGNAGLPYTASGVDVTGIADSVGYYVKQYCADSSLSASSNTVDYQTGQAVADDWAARVVANGGADPSAATKLAAATFWTGMIVQGLSSKVAWLSIYAPDSLIACLTPFIVGPGTDPITNNGPFVSGDLTVNGLAGNGTTKSLNPGISSNTLCPSANLGTMAVVSTTSTDNNPVIGILLNNSKDFNIRTQFATNAYGSFWYGGGGIGQIGGSSGGAAYYMVTRTSKVLCTLYKAKTGFAHASIGTATYDMGTNDERGASGIYVHGGSNTTESPHRLSFALLSGEGWSAAQSSALFTLVQALRTTLGGGTV